MHAPPRYSGSDWSGVVPYASAVVFTGLYVALSLRRFARLDTPSWDNAIFEQAIKHYAHLQPPIVNIKAPGFNILGDHFSPIIALIAPIYRVFPTAQTLMIAQAVLIGVSIIPISRAATRTLGTAGGVAVTVAYGLSFGIQSAIYVDFHEVAFSAPLMAFAGEAYLRRRWTAMAGWLVPLLLVKEDLGVTVAAAGAIAAWCGAKRVGSALGVIGVAGFLLTVFVAIPFFGTGTFAYWDAVGIGDTGPSAWENLAADWDLKTVTLLLTFGITGFAALRSKWALLAIPTLAWRFIGEKTAYWGTDWHYSLILMPIVFIALIDVVPLLQRTGRRWLAAYTSHVPTLAAGIAVALCLTYPLGTLLQADTWQPSPRAAAAHEATALIPPGASVATNRGLITHLVTDHTVYWIGTVGAVVPDYVLIDTHTGPDVASAARYAAAEHPGTLWRQVFARDGYLVAQHEVSRAD